MKKAILTIGLFSLVMILTSFTTPEKTDTFLINSFSVDLTGNQGAGGNKKVDLTGNQGAGGNKKVDLTGNQGAGGNKKVDLTGNQGAGGNKKVD
ncbi:3-oxoacyl-ACP reductase [Flavobacterium sp. RSP29]|uniref:3-oxoacyl-ACP reductase n=1 Tax=Flavobacterium sp. RSP29 TaxID=3401731 RepID=UPI003AAED291